METVCLVDISILQSDQNKFQMPAQTRTEDSEPGIPGISVVTLPVSRLPPTTGSRTHKLK